ncbi:immunoglobulin kappa light chain-like [Sebastes fasciatus]|uniref:immunoglobulin kappa light chain-like n=1 Tax=Sebastes fasciatus TaxID=394691 RepID=UPI003D9F2713
MIGRQAALFLLSTIFICLFSSDLIQTAEVSHQIPTTVVEVGVNVTLHCPVSKKDGHFFYWYKQPLGFMIQTVVTGTFTQPKLDTQFNNQHFKVTAGKNQYNLTITNVSKEDEATYFCHTGTAYSQSFVNGIYLAVNDRNQQKSFYVKQSPKSVQPGDSVTLQCSLHSKNKEVQCPRKQNVYWFRSGSRESHPGIIYTHSDEQLERSCVYSLSKTIQNSSDNGTYYCAVVTCGEILLGEGTKVETRQELDPVIIILGILLVLCLIVIIILVFSRN